MLFSWQYAFNQLIVNIIMWNKTKSFKKSRYVDPTTPIFNFKIAFRILNLARKRCLFNVIHVVTSISVLQFYFWWWGISFNNEEKLDKPCYYFGLRCSEDGTRVECAFLREKNEDNKKIDYYWYSQQVNWILPMY